MKSIIKIYSLLLLAFFATSCDNWLDINEDPNNPTSAPISSLMIRTIFETSDNIQNLGIITSFYVQQLASPNQASATDIHEEVAYDQTWFELYDVMTDLSDLEILAEEQGAQNYLGVAKILKALNLGMSVDMWGDMPYSEAFFVQTLTPAYDDDQALYQEIITLLDEGITAINTGEATVDLDNEDLIYEGDTQLWLKTAYALKARYLLHSNNVNTTEILAAIDNAYESNGEDAQLIYFEGEDNPWATVAINNENLLLGGWISSQLVEAMDGTTFNVVDPRMPFMFGTTDNDEFIGTDNGAGRGDAAEQGERSTLVTDSYYAAEDAPLHFITFAELKFIEAEVALATDQARAYTAYQAGIRAHMEKIGVEAADVNTYINDPAVSVGAANLTQELIMKEKYIAMFLHPEAWVDARRFDYQYQDMTLPANHNPELSGQFIRRLIYPESETQRNGSNVPQVSLSDRIWWDQ